MIHYQNAAALSDTLCRRLYTRIAIDEATQCWLFVGTLRSGYGRIQYRGKNLSTHRVSWEFWHGAIPAGYDVHHLCRNTACCNPAHLQAVTKREHLVNLTPGHVAYRHARVTRCPKGHELAGGNLEPCAQREGRRRCLLCHRASSRAAQRRYMAKKKGK